MRSLDLAGHVVLVVDGDGPSVGASQIGDVLTASFEVEAHTVAIAVGRLDPTFFKLRTGVAGELLQKLVQYGRRLVVVGELPADTLASRSFSGFVLEGNRGDGPWFVATLDELADRLSAGLSRASDDVAGAVAFEERGSEPSVNVDLGYSHPRLAATYDAENAGRDDIEFYIALARELGARDVSDVGCGTGVLACELAAAGCAVTGVDPAAAMLSIARSRPGGERVRWIHSDASDLPAASADLLVMTGHVAQVFVEDADWDELLAQARRIVRPGGHLAFETRNPAVESWRGWTREASFGTFRLPDGSTFDSWVQTTDATHDRVTFDAHSLFAADGRELVSRSTLRFRNRDEVASSLDGAGFTVQTVYGDWDRSPASPSSPELIFVARRR